MFILLGQATASANSKYKTGDRHGVLVFVPRETMGDAVAFALAEMPTVGWEQIMFENGRPIDGPIKKEDPALAGAYRTAEAGGCGIVVYMTQVMADKSNLTKKEPH